MKAVFPKAPSLFFRLYVYIGFFGALLRFVSIHRLLEFFSGPKTRFLFSCSPEESQRLLLYLNFILSHWPFRSAGEDCLVRSTLLFCFLKPTHKDLKIVSGVMRAEPEGLKAHCWLEVGERPLFDDPDTLGRFQRLFVFG